MCPNMSELECPKLLKIIIVGEGGQGVQTVAKLISRASHKLGYHSTYIPNFGTEQRGGLSLAFVQVSCEKIVSPKFNESDIYVIVSSRDIERSLRYIGHDTNVIYDKDLITLDVKRELLKKSESAAAMNAFELATNQLTERSFNIVILGMLIGLVDTNLKDIIEKMMDKKFEKYYQKRPELKKMNDKALNLGFNLTQNG